MTAHLRYLALGDSYTIGEGVTAGETWPNRLAEQLRGEGIQIDDPRVIATTGWTTGELESAIAAERPAHDYALVSLLIGVNDQYRGSTASSYQIAFERLLDSAVVFARGEPHRVVILSIPDWGVTPFAAGRDRDQIREQIDAFNAVSHAAAQLCGAHYVDVTEESRRAGDAADHLVADGLHPSGIAYAEWTRRALPAARRAVSGEPPLAFTR